MKKSFILFFILFLHGCVGDQKGHQTAVVGSPPVSIPDPETFRQGLKGDLHTELVSSSNSTQAQMSGLVNTTVSKLAEKLVGVEAQIDSLVKVQTEISNTANVRADLTVKAVTDMKAEINARFELSAKLDSTIQATAELKNTIGEIKAQLSVMATANTNAQVGLKNDLTNTISTLKNDIAAGHDVTQNYLPREAVDVINAANRTTQYVMSGAFGLMTTLLYFLYRGKSIAAADATQKLQRAMVHVPQERLREFVGPSNT